MSGRTRALVVGESLVDIISTSNGRSVHPGGSPLNVAFGLGRLAVPTELLTEFGDDAYGTLLAEHLRSAGVGVIRPAGGQRATSSAAVAIDADGAARYSFDLRWTLQGPVAPPTVGFIHTGSIAAVMQPGSDAVFDLFDSTDSTVVRSYDPNVRPAIMGDPDDVRARVDRLIGRADVVKLSDEDAGWLYPGTSDDQVCDRVLELGAALVALTRGPGGCILATRAARLQRPAMAVKVVDSIGAGDSFMSALLFALARTLEAAPSGPADSMVPAIAGYGGSELDSLAHTALTSAAITVSREGAMPPTLAELLGHPITREGGSHHSPRA